MDSEARMEKGGQTMARITQKDLDQLVTVLRNATGNKTYRIEYAYGRPRLYWDRPGLTTRNGIPWHEEVSPRLPKGELYQWISAYIDGIAVGYEIGKADAIKERN
jgi:hypothetical protein